MIYATQERDKYLDPDERRKYNSETREAIWGSIEGALQQLNGEDKTALVSALGADIQAKLVHGGEHAKAAEPWLTGGEADGESAMDAERIIREAKEDTLSPTGWLGEAQLAALLKLKPRRVRVIGATVGGKIRLRECYPSGGHSEWFDLDENIRKRKNFRLPGIIPVLHQGHYWQLAFEDGEKLDEEYLELERGLALSLLPTYRNGGLAAAAAGPTALYGVEVIETYELSDAVAVTVAKGSVVNFSGDAIVNAANESCIAGGGVDGAIGLAGGRALSGARERIPTIDRKGTKRCRTGSAVTTISGRLPCKKAVIHAVGPDYRKFKGRAGVADELLASAYAAAMKAASEEGVETLAFSLLSAGIYCGGRDLRAVLKIGLESIEKASRRSSELPPKHIFIVAFSEEEERALTEQARGVFGGVLSGGGGGGGGARPKARRRRSVPSSDERSDDGVFGGGVLPTARFTVHSTAPHQHSNITDSLEPEQAAEVEGVWSKFEGASTQEKVWDEDKKRWEMLLDEERALAEVVTLPIGAGGSKVHLLGKHIDRLRPGNWLFDESITMYMKLLQTRFDKRKHLDGAERWFFWNSITFGNLESIEAQPRGGLSSRVGKAKLTRIFDKVVDPSSGGVFVLGKLIIPVNDSGTHWTLLVANFKNRSFQYYDSLRGDGKKWAALLKSALRQEAERWKGRPAPEGFSDDEWEGRLDMESWVDEYPKHGAFQKNGFDCGVFVCGFASYIAKLMETDFPFSQDDINTMRARITYDLLHAMEELSNSS